MQEETKNLLDDIRNKLILERENKSENENDSLSKDIDIEKKIHMSNLRIQEAEEIQKRELRNWLTKTVKGFIWVQIIFFNLIVGGIVMSVIVDISIFKNVDKELAEVLFEFLKYYISVTVVELLGMLAFILHYVFSRYKKENIDNNKDTK